MLVVSGESLMDVFVDPQQTGDRLALTATAGGSPFNCAIALARMGRQTGFLCPISRDLFGDILADRLAGAGVVRLLAERVRAPTTLAMVTLDEARKASYVFYREADRAATSQTLLAALPPAIEFYQIGGFVPLIAEDAQAWAPVVDAAAQRGATIAMDPNVRPLAITDRDSYLSRLDGFFDRSHLIKVSEEDLEYLFGPGGAEDGARKLLARENCRLVVVTLGEHGAFAMTRSAAARAGVHRVAQPEPGADTVGAGDTLMAGIVAWLADHGRLAPDKLSALSEGDLGRMLAFGTVAAGINCGRAGANPPMRSEILAALASGDPDRASTYLSVDDSSYHVVVG